MLARVAGPDVPQASRTLRFRRTENTENRDTENRDTENSTGRAPSWTARPCAIFCPLFLLSSVLCPLLFLSSVLCRLLFLSSVLYPLWVCLSLRTHERLAAARFQVA